MDLRFPHHENERAQAVALGRRFANQWMHNGFVVDPEGEKMSKSLGNFDNLLDLLESLRRPRLPTRRAAEPLPRRRCASAATASARRERALAGLDAFAARTDALVPTSGHDDADAAVLERFVDLMDDDLDTPGATALLFDTVRRANTARRRRRPRRGGAAGGRGARDRRRRSGLTFGSTDAVPAEVSERAGELDAARATRDYARADAIRAELQDAGWIVETTATGTTVRR